MLRDPPNSFSATLDLRIASRSEVLPWSTWPMTVTMGARGWSADGSSSSKRTSFVASSVGASASVSVPAPFAETATGSAIS